jgi:hypothetical protein
MESTRNKGYFLWKPMEQVEKFVYTDIMFNKGDCYGS